MENKKSELDNALAHGEMVANALTMMFKQLEEPRLEYHFDIDLAIEKMNEAKSEEEAPMTRKRLSDETGIGYRTLTHYQNGKLPVVLIQIAKIMAMSGLSFEDLFKLKNQEL